MGLGWRGGASLSHIRAAPLGASLSLPVLQLPGDALGDAATQQAYEEEHADGQGDYKHDVVLGGRQQDLPGQV